MNKLSKFLQGFLLLRWNPFFNNDCSICNKKIDSYDICKQICPSCQNAINMAEQSFFFTDAKCIYCQDNKPIIYPSFIGIKDDIKKKISCSKCYEKNNKTL